MVFTCSNTSPSHQGPVSTSWIVPVHSVLTVVPCQTLARGGGSTILVTVHTPRTSFALALLGQASLIVICT